MTTPLNRAIELIDTKLNREWMQVELLEYLHDKYQKASIPYDYNNSEAEAFHNKIRAQQIKGLKDEQLAIYEKLADAMRPAMYAQLKAEINCSNEWHGRNHIEEFKVEHVYGFANWKAEEELGLGHYSTSCPSCNKKKLIYHCYVDTTEALEDKINPKPL